MFFLEQQILIFSPAETCSQQLKSRFAKTVHLSISTCLFICTGGMFALVLVYHVLS